MAEEISKEETDAQIAVRADHVAKIVEAANQFACDLYSQIAGSTPGNLFFSPSSIWTALAMTYAGAAGETAKEMADTLHLSLPDAELNPAIKLLHDSIKPASVKLSIANRLWGQQGYHFLSAFTETIERFYGASVQQVDFRERAEEARLQINNWIEEQTGGKLRDFIPPGMLAPLTRLVLVNAIYFLGRWDSVFSESDTHPAPFWIGPSKCKTVATMQQCGSYAYGEFEDLTVLEMPYESQVWPLIEDNEDGLEGWRVAETPVGTGDLAMTLLLPRQVDGLKQIETQLTPNVIRKWTSVKEAFIDLNLPKFRIESDIGLNEILVMLGMHKPFLLKDADFSRMSDDPEGLYLSAVLHKAFVDVNEEGTEAAAATCVAMCGAGRSPEPKIFRVDHPFLFLIRDRETGLIFFCGRVVDPSV